jgi:hypothetical protein
VGPRAGLDTAEKRKFLTPPGLELRPLSRPARSQSLYRLRYPGSPLVVVKLFIVTLKYSSFIGWIYLLKSMHFPPKFVSKSWRFCSGVGSSWSRTLGRQSSQM